MREVEPKKPLKRMLLRSFKSEQHYVRKLESMIIGEGKRILGNKHIHFEIIKHEDIQKFIERYPEFYNTRWHQIGLERMYNDRRLDSFEYDFLITMKQVLNKNNRYLLRPDEFDARNQIMNCKRFENKKLQCVQDECKVKLDCPLYKNIKKVE